ncbi:hypothetical protein VZT92_014057 [Zoarces viviparus]|uniref:Chemokine interleukin-8-like domain-containing protein n=1 Tax=Zoarces viviparus TaxID=48416 RepID=A0AAW1EZH5_ZOAVI
MKLLSILTLALLWVAIQAAGHHGCCTAFSEVHAVKSILKRGGAVQCRRQGITEGCSITAVVMKWKHRQVCVASTPHKIRSLLAILCKRKSHKGVRSSDRLHRRKTM